MSADGSISTPGARKTEMITRAISMGGNIVSRGYIEANEPEVKGHLECRGLILGSKGSIHAIPELKATSPVSTYTMKRLSAKSPKKR